MEPLTSSSNNSKKSTAISQYLKIRFHSIRNVCSGLESLIVIRKAEGDWSTFGNLSHDISLWPYKSVHLLKQSKCCSKLLLWEPFVPVFHYNLYLPWTYAAQVQNAFSQSLKQTCGQNAPTVTESACFTAESVRWICTVSLTKVGLAADSLIPWWTA